MECKTIEQSVEDLIKSNNALVPQVEQNTEDIKNLQAKQSTLVNVGGIQQEILNFSSDPQSQIDKKLNKTDIHLKFNQIFNTSLSTLPSGSGLTISNIYGGHHIEGTTTSQYYHKMYSIDTINGHWYYFASNFSNTSNVYIVGKVDGTSFNTKTEKVFQGGDKFDITLQIEKDKTINTDLKPILIDLTSMFGKGNEPQSVEEVQEYVVKGTYYQYDSSSIDITTLASKVETNTSAIDSFNYKVNSENYYPLLDGSYIFTGSIFTETFLLLFKNNGTLVQNIECNSAILLNANNNCRLTYFINNNVKFISFKANEISSNTYPELMCKLEKS